MTELFTLKDCVLLALNPGIMMSASEVCKLANKLYHREAKLQSVSSLLHKLASTGYVERIDGFGRNGGYGYRKINHASD